jgi:type VI secretion system protein ImpH
VVATHRHTTPDLIPLLEQEAHDFAFFQAVELLLREAGAEVEEQALAAQGPTSILFRGNPSLGFPSSDLASVSRLATADGQQEVIAVSVNFMGLHGSASPLPYHMLETALWSQGEEGVQQAFNDFFTNRLVWMLYLTWRKYRYYIRYRPGAQDQFSDWMFALIGFGARDSRKSSDIPWAKLLPYLGLISGRTRSADMLAGVIAHAFSLPDVTVRQFEEQVVTIPADQRSCPGRCNAVLGESFMIGDSVTTIAGKFTIVLRHLSFERFQDFLPLGKEFPRLKDLVAFLLRDQLAYNLELEFDPGETPRFVLGDESKSELGWTTFVGDPVVRGTEPVLLQVRE